MLIIYYFSFVLNIINYYDLDCIISDFNGFQLETSPNLFIDKINYVFVKIPIFHRLPATFFMLSIWLRSNEKGG